MVFAIGWSSVSVASIKTMNMQLQHEQMSTHCQQMNQQTSAAQMTHMQDDHAELAPCLSDLKTGKMQHQNCFDCSSMLCQTIVLGMTVPAFVLSAPLIDDKNNNMFSSYQAQHLAGHWQEILRPPKA